MKVLIWVGWLIITTIVSVFIGELTGIEFGALFLAGVFIFGGKVLCHEWDEYKKRKKAEEDKSEPAECAKCETEAMETTAE